jgi:LuxR family maltose regulon positive regulatory protein
LQLAALSMQGLDGRAIPRFIEAFTGSHHYIVDYLVEEVLGRQPESIRTFLLQTSILDRFCAPLCDAVTSRADSRAMLDHLRAANIFLIALDHERNWYRYHHLFAELLRSRLYEASDPAELKALHRRASHWYEANHLLPQAIDHAFTADDLPQAAALIERLAVSLLDEVLWGPEITQIRRWLERLPEELLLQRPNLLVAHAQVALLTMTDHQDIKVVERRVRDLELLLAADQAAAGHTAAQSRQPGLYGGLYILQAYLKFFVGEVQEAIDLAGQALQYLPPERYLWRMAGHSVQGAGYTNLGDLKAADAAYERVTALAQKMEDSQRATIGGQDAKSSIPRVTS